MTWFHSYFFNYDHPPPLSLQPASLCQRPCLGNLLQQAVAQARPLCASGGGIISGGQERKVGGATGGGEAVSAARTGELRESGHQGAVARQRGSGESEKRQEAVVANTGTVGGEMQKGEGSRPRGLCQFSFTWIPRVSAISVVCFPAREGRMGGCDPAQAFKCKRALGWILLRAPAI